jgi:UV DNA damage endonuclease
MIRHLGYACQNLSLQTGRKLSERIQTSRTIRMSNFRLQRAGELAVKNSADLLPILKWNAENNIKFFRIGSDIFSFMDHPDLGYTLEEMDSNHSRDITANFAAAGEFAKANGMRLSCHPGPYTCLASPNPKIVEKSITSLRMHSLVADLLGYGEEFAINIHVGGVYEDKATTAKRFVEVYQQLPPLLQKRLTLENDDKASMWSIQELYDMIYKHCGVKLVLDVHHHRFCDGGNTVQAAAQLAFSTWTGFSEIPKVHYSESKPDSRPQAHSDYIKEPIPLLCNHTQYDIMIEAKAKDLALIHYKKEVLNETTN